MRALQPDSLHLTLCFLGSRPLAEIEALAEALARGVAPVGELSLGAPLLLPRRRPRALAVEVHDPQEALSRLQARLLVEIARACAAEPAERRRLRAHITVARISAGARHGAFGGALPATPPGRFTPRTIGLYRSWLEPAGARYETVASCELPAPPG